jgi:hypothetical protein
MPGSCWGPDYMQCMLCSMQQVALRLAMAMQVQGHPCSLHPCHAMQQLRGCCCAPQLMLTSGQTLFVMA